MQDHDDQTDELAALEEELEQLRHAVVSHAVVDQAIGVVVAHGAVRVETGWEILKEISQHTNTKLREVAEHLVHWPHCGWLPPEIHRGLYAALEHRKQPPLSAQEPWGLDA